MTQDLKGRSALITGGLTGQGFAIAQALAAKGANVAVGSYIGASKGRSGDAAAYPEPEEAETVRRKLAESGTKVYAGHLDIRDTAVIKSFIESAAALRNLRYPGECRRHHRRASGLRPYGRALAQNHRHQPEWRLSHDARTAAGHDRAEMGPRDQHWFNGGLSRLER